MTTEKDIARRNERLFEFFNYFFPNRIMVFGKEDSPAVIYKLDDGSIVCLNCYVRNFWLILTDAPREGNVVAEIKLMAEIDKESATVLLDWMTVNEHRAVYRVGMPDADLWISGWNFRDKHNRTDRYPVFSRQGYQVYWSQDFAENLVDDYPDYGLGIR